MIKSIRISVLFSFVLVAGVSFFPGCKKSDNKVVARVGSSKITQEDFEKELAGSPPAYLSYLSTLEGKKQFLDILLREKILMNAAEKSGVEKSKEVQKSLKDYKEQIKQQEAEFRKGLLLKEYLRQLQDGELKVTEPEMKLYYDQNKADFQNPVKVTGSHILCATQSDAERALKRIKSGEDFSKVAREMSTDPSATRGGMIGEVTRGDLAELSEFENTLFALKSGGVSNIIKTKLGYHIIKKNGEVLLPGQTFEQAVPKIRRTLEKKKFDQWVDKTKTEQKYWVDEQLLASIRLPSAEQEPPKEHPRTSP